MTALKNNLRRLPKEDYDTAIDYFEEYFADAGSEQESQVIEDLGSPQFAAEQVITTLALNNAKEPVQGVKKGLHAVWIGLLAICAAPIALPIALLLLLIPIIIFLAFIFVGVILILFAPICMIGSFTVIAESIPVFISCMGLGFMLLGIGLLITYGSISLCKAGLSGIVRSFGKIIKRRERNEKR